MANIELLSAQLLYLQAKLTQKVLSESLSQIEESNKTNKNSSKSYIEDYSPEIENHGLILQLINIYENHSKLLNTIKVNVVNSVEILCTELKKLKGDEVENMKFDEPFDNLPSILEAAEDIGGLDSELEAVYESISELREAGSRIDKTEDKLKACLEKLYSITKLQKKLRE